MFHFPGTVLKVEEEETGRMREFWEAGVRSDSFSNVAIDSVKCSHVCQSKTLEPYCKKQNCHI